MRYLSVLCMFTLTLGLYTNMASLPADLGDTQNAKAPFILLLPGDILFQTLDLLPYTTQNPLD
jgi:hypothetical protein